MHTLLAHCSALFSAQHPVFLAFLTAGLVGGFTHCVAMCGAFSACGNLCSGSCHSTESGFRKLWKTLNLPYHLGRGATYGFLGGVAALLGRQVSTTPYWGAVSSAMLIIAGLMFLWSSIAPSASHRLHHGAMAWLGPVVKGQPFIQGMLLGFMPCGLSYAAIMLAATLANPFYGMAAMWVFTLGTLPALSIANFLTAYAARRWQHASLKAGRVLMAFNGLLLLATATLNMG